MLSAQSVLQDAPHINLHYHYRPPQYPRSVVSTKAVRYQMAPICLKQRGPETTQTHCHSPITLPGHFGYIAHMDDNADAKRILSTLPPEDWRRPQGSPHITWLSIIQQDLRSHNFTLPEAMHMDGPEPVSVEDVVNVCNLELHARNDDEQQYRRAVFSIYCKLKHLHFFIFKFFTSVSTDSFKVLLGQPLRLIPSTS